uniref:Small heat shock protein 21.4 n=1 Tax=Laodelphax striatellus TaxID=195883 RepID=A0A3G2WJH5_LAOST|nr:small heat shock protein 21.4 [Laodelphax striatellus]
MSLLLRDLLDDIYNPANIYDQHFGLGLLNDELQPSSHSLLSVPLSSGYVRPWRHLHSDNSGVSTIEADENNFKVNLDVQQFKPEEISVKLSGNDLVIEGKHEERKDKHGYVSRQFTRRYTIPDNFDLEKSESKLSSDGILSLMAPKKIEASTTQRSIPIVRTNQPALKQQQHQITKDAKKQNGEKMES